MSLRIFLSSTHRDFVPERTALQERIGQLQSVFVGMEHFGSDPALPADMCESLVRSSDLMVCLIGDSYGSIDAATGLSFTELEYRAAADLLIPCLVYFRASAGDAPARVDERLARFKNHLQSKHVVHQFTAIDKLAERFLLDFIKLLQGPLQAKAQPTGGGHIPAATFHAFTNAALPEHINIVAEDKYVAGLYVDRPIVERITAWAFAEDTFRTRVAEMVDWLHEVDHDRRLNAASAVRQLQSDLLDSDDHGLLTRSMDAVRAAFHAKATDAVLADLWAAARTAGEGDFGRRGAAAILSMQTLPFISQPASDLFAALRKVRQDYIIAPTVPAAVLLRTVHPLFPSKLIFDREGVLTKVELATDKLRELQDLLDSYSRRCLAVVDRAGTGKTNILCRVAEHLSDKHPVYVLTGRTLLDHPDDIERYVQRGLEQRFSGLFGDWLDRVTPHLRARRQWLFVIVDGINEADSVSTMGQRLSEILARAKTRRVKLIVSCRDISWESFQRRLEPHIVDGVPLPVDSFDDLEFEDAVARYFEHFSVGCELGADARRALHHPLLLRVFSEAHRGQSLGRVDDVRRVEVFDLYVQRAIENARDGAPRLRAADFLETLIQVGEAIWIARKMSIQTSALSRAAESRSDTATVYGLLLQESIIAEDGGLDYAGRRTRFTFDEIAEYVIARSWVRTVMNAPDPSIERERILSAAIQSITQFGPTLGAALFSDQMLKARGQMVADLLVALSRNPETLLALNQTKILHALDYLPDSRFDEPVLQVLDAFESWASDDTRRRLSRVLKRAVAHAPSSPTVRGLMKRLLEVDETRVGDQTGAPRDDRPSSGQTLTERGKPAEDGKLAEEKHALPPAMFHYDEATKLNAIAVLLTLPDGRDLAAAGMQQLGQLDMHHALQALAALDSASDDTVFRAVERQQEAASPEYRLYSAWLLRNRLGPRPAKSLFRLVMDGNARVHRYAVRVIERRGVEDELMELAVQRLETTESESWHAVNLIRVLGRWNADSNRPDSHALERVVAVLSSQLRHAASHVRAEALTALCRSKDIALTEHLRRMATEEQDPYLVALLRALAR